MPSGAEAVAVIGLVALAVVGARLVLSVVMPRFRGGRVASMVVFFAMVYVVCAVAVVGFIALHGEQH